MILKSGLSFWLLNDGVPQWYDSLHQDASTDVLILGGGISGALIAHTLISSGIECMVVDKRLVGLGSTSASTSLIQYEIDVPLSSLIKKVGKRNAIRAYEMSREAVGKLLRIASAIGFKEINKRQSLYFAASDKDIDMLKKEFYYRKKYHFDVVFLNKKEILEAFRLVSSGAILSQCAAATDGYLFTHCLFKDCQGKGVRVFSQSQVTNIDICRDHAIAQTNKGVRIRARRVVYAVGYEGLKYLDQRFGEVRTTYALSGPAGDNLPTSIKNTVFWNTADPYFYMRSSGENNLLIGGRDDRFYSPEIMQQSIDRKADGLLADFHHVFPDFELTIGCRWAGLFVTTRDGLPFIGRFSKLPNCYFALGYGGNGITFSVIAAEIIRDLILGHKNPDARMFSLSRHRTH